VTDKIIDLFGYKKNNENEEECSDFVPVEDSDFPLVSIDKRPDGTDILYSLRWWESTCPGWGRIGYQIVGLQRSRWMSDIHIKRVGKKMRANYLPLYDGGDEELEADCSSAAFWAACLIHDAQLAPDRESAEAYWEDLLDVGVYRMTVRQFDAIYHIQQLLPEIFANGGVGDLLLR
jgi:hypothetical protein